MAFLPQGSSAQVAISAGQSIAVGAVRGATANVTYPVGYPKGPSDTVVNGTETFGPFATATTVTVYASQGTAEYVTGTNPVCTDGPVALATDPLTGGVVGLVGPDGYVSSMTSPYQTLNSASNLQLRKMFANVLAGGRERLAIWGDSTTAGAGAGTNGAGAAGLVGAYSKNWVSYLAAAMTAAGIPTWNQGLFGSQNVEGDTGITYNAYDPRAVFSGFTSTAVGCPGSNAWLSTGIGSTIAFTPAMTFDRFDVYTIQNTANGTITVNVDGGATLATIACAGSPSVVKTTVTCARATHVINIATTLAANTYVIGVVPWDSTIGGLDIVQCGNYGSVMSQFSANSNPWNPSNATLVTALGASQHIVQLTVNDSKNSTVPATYATQLATFQTALGANTIFMSGLPSSNAQATNGQNAAILQAMKDRAASQSLRYLAQTERLVDWATVNGYGWMYDILHGNAKCYSDEARWVARTLTAIA